MTESSHLAPFIIILLVILGVLKDWRDNNRR